MSMQDQWGKVMVKYYTTTGTTSSSSAFDSDSSWQTIGISPDYDFQKWSKRWEDYSRYGPGKPKELETYEWPEQFDFSPTSPVIDEATRKALEAKQKEEKLKKIREEICKLIKTVEVDGDLISFIPAEDLEKLYKAIKDTI